MGSNQHSGEQIYSNSGGTSFLPLEMIGMIETLLHNHWRVKLWTEVQRYPLQHRFPEMEICFPSKISF